jgi:hypothetical protein
MAENFKLGHCHGNQPLGSRPGPAAPGQHRPLSRVTACSRRTLLGLAISAPPEDEKRCEGRALMIFLRWSIS